MLPIGSEPLRYLRMEKEISVQQLLDPASVEELALFQFPTLAYERMKPFDA